MRELRQADYNPDELSWEVIEEISSRLFEHPIPSRWYSLYEHDKDLFERVNAGDDTDEARDQWNGAEREWRDYASHYGIEVYDDGEAGWTYVGDEAEVAKYYEEEN